MLFKRLKREKSKFTITKEEAAAKFVQTLNARGKALPKTRPQALRRKSGNPRARTQPGSFSRDIKFSIRIIGAIQTDKEFQKYIAKLQNVINTFVNMDTRGNIKAKAPTINISKQIVK